MVFNLFQMIASSSYARPVLHTQVHQEITEAFSESFEKAVNLLKPRFWFRTVLRHNHKVKNSRWKLPKPPILFDEILESQDQLQILVMHLAEDQIL